MTALLTAAVLTGCSAKLPTSTLDVGGHAVVAEIAYTLETRQRGLMHRDGLGTDKGMLFIYPDESPRGFWMKDTRIPLSIAFADRTGKIVKIANMRPHDLTRVPSVYPATYALEMTQGWFAANGIEKGTVIGDIPDFEAE